MGSGSDADKNYALFQARLLAGPAAYDPVEEHMRNVLMTIGWWSALIAVVAAAVAWFSDPLLAALVVGVLTVGVAAVLVRVARGRANLDSEAAGP